MHIVTHFLVAPEEDIVDIGAATQPLKSWRGIERRGVGSEKLVMLHSLLTDDAFDLAVSFYEPVYVSDEGAMVLPLAARLLDALADLDEESLETLAEELAASESFEVEGWPVDEVRDLLIDLSDLAQQAAGEELPLFARISPLLAG
jgi:hypothetical protein